MPKESIPYRPLRFSYADTRRWVITGALIATTAYGAVLIVSLRLLGWQPERQVPLFVAAALCLWAARLAGRGKVREGGIAAIAAVWTQVHFAMLVATTFPAPGLLATPVLLLCGGLILLPRHSSLLALVSSVSAWPFVMLSPAVQAKGLTPLIGYWLAVHSVICLGTWGLVRLGFSIVDRAFDEVVHKERALAETIDRAPDGILVLDGAGVVQVANPAALKLLGLPADEFIGRPLADVLRGASVSDLPDDLPTPADTGECPRTWRFERAAGGHVTLEITWRAMDSGRRQLVLRDLSERVLAEQARHDMEARMAHAQRLEAIGQLAGGIAHDFNNILTIVGASTEVLRIELADEQYAPLIDEILAARDRGALLTRQLLAFARREVVNPRVFDLSEQVLALRRLLQRVAGEQTRIVCNVEPDCRINADLGQLEQSLVNLVTNARDAMPEGGTCTISVVRMTNDDATEWVRLRVTDEGSGMDPDTRTRAFEP
ncbi:MAG TPA: PAS domain-containing protein, partial [Gemmatimonadaceae bacterium]|nr:PAS domain-containing protein [Gemmatimonadaceae bacterium]